jgi:hypothetical protein
VGDIVRKRRRLGEILVEMGVLSRHDLEHFFRTRMQPGLFLGDQLVRASLISAEDLARALARQFSLPYVNLRTTPPEAEAVAAIRVETAERYLAVPSHRGPSALQVATALPQRRGLVQTLESESGYAVTLAVASRPGIEQAIRHWYRTERGTPRHAADDRVTIVVRYRDALARNAPREERQVTLLNLSETGACLHVSTDPAAWSADEPLRLESRAVKRWANPAPPPAYGWRVGLEFQDFRADARLLLNRHLEGNASR